MEVTRRMNDNISEINSQTFKFQKLIILFISFCISTWLVRGDISLTRIFGLLGILVFQLDWGELFCMKNIMLIAIHGYFVSGIWAFDVDNKFQIDYFMFLFGWGIAVVMTEKFKFLQYKIVSILRLGPNSVDAQRWGKNDIANYIFYLLFFLRMCWLLYLIMTFGIQGIWNGNHLVARMQIYGQQNTGAGFQTIISYALQLLNIVFITLMFQESGNENRKRWAFRAVVLLLLTPCLLLQRSEVLINSIFLFYALSLHNKKGRRIFSPSLKVILVGCVVISAGLGFAVMVGQKRQTLLESNIVDREETQIGIANSALAEVSGFKIYQDTRSDNTDLTPQFGATIVLPMITKVFPRNWFPNKPLNSSGYYMNMMYQDSAVEGYYLAPWIFGDLAINFGFMGSVIAFSLMCTCLFVIEFVTNRTKFAWLQLLIFINIYPIIRSNLADSISSLAFEILIVIIVTKLVRRSEVIYI